jgi:predicted transcriptional regulator of viral defense system
MDIRTGQPALRGDLLRAGVTDDEMRRALRNGLWCAVRPGAYLRVDDPALAEPEQRHVQLVLATVARLDGTPVVSHLSAAALHGLPLWGVPLRTVHVTRDVRSGGRRTRHLHVHPAPIGSDEVVVVRGLPVTSAARTVVDVARTVRFESAVVIADAALKARLCSRDELEVAVARAGRRSGGPASRRVVAFANGLADGPGESRSRVRMHLAGLPRPVLQHEVHDRNGLRIGQVDFWWRQAGVIGEYDGAIKYGRLLRPGQDPATVMYREKLREDALRAQPGVRTVVRWTWRDIEEFDELASRLREAVGPG